MAKIDDVILGIECMIGPETFNEVEQCKESGCPYSGTDCVLEIWKDALDLLKFYKPVKAYRLHGEKVIDGSEKVFTGQCTNCFCYLVEGWKACPVCGKTLEWEKKDG